MPTRPIDIHRQVSVQQHASFHSKTLNQTQHGSLLDLPRESLTHITTYLTPPSLLALARTCRHLCEHVDDDNTWRCAFLNQFFGISPEHAFESGRILLLKRTENTWRKEFLFRRNIRQRWERSRRPTVTHSPQHSSIDGVHLISEHGLLTSSIQYGIVARSIPLNGKVLKGYIDASGTGLNIGNPNVEFTPNVSTCIMASDGGTARVFWGKRNGEVALTIASRVMDSRPTSKFIRCGVNDQHEGAVQQLVPDSHTNTLLSGGADGRIKLWDTKNLDLLWSTEKQQLSLITDPFISIAGSLDVGFVAGALNSGDILLYDLHESPSDGPRIRSTHQLRIPSLIHNEGPGDGQKVWLYRTGEMSVLLLVHYTHHPHFYRIDANVQSHHMTITSFGDSSFGSISTLVPIMSPHTHDNNMLLVGDVLGFVSFYDLDVARTPVAPLHKFEAHTDGAVTAISWSPTVFATGSARGTTVVWDSLTLEAMRYFTTPAPRPASGNDWDGVRQILVDKELVVIIVGNRVMTWKVADVNSSQHHHKKPKHANNKTNITTKGHQQYEMSKDIAESYRELEYERAHSQRIYDREREQRSTLDELGLSESEAVEYVLMLSREEEARRQQATINFATPSRSTHPRSNDCQYPRVSPPISNEKVQVSPPFVPEPMKVDTSLSPAGSLTINTRTSLDQFPAINSSLSSTSQGNSRSAWSKPLKSVSSSPGSGAERSSEEMDEDLRLAIELSLAWEGTR